ncbi:hypothetical protein PsorP6_005595 [Peronosclerospora sorghi]|uniref:Uncharacterized protein n=1 Tax=Peronosclerospora sorghi TaxID=230839 RepID=A0ACC0W3D0_9STRA|nr:hypothetical protein PsorP6_005595 [Peronosclerospora sorghi]
MLAVARKSVRLRAIPVDRRCYSSHTKLWDLFPAKTPVQDEAPQYLMNMQDTLEFALERMRITEGRLGLHLLHYTPRKPKKTSHGNKSSLRYRKRFGRRFGK